MKITPLEIRQKSFEKNFRGYDKDEVDAYLQSLSQEWERNLEELKEHKIRLELAEKEVQKLREVESSLFKTLKTAEETSSSMVDQAAKKADLQVRESQLKADQIVNEAKENAKRLKEEAAQHINSILEDLHQEIKQLEDYYNELESHKDSLLRELKTLASDTLDKTQKLGEKLKKPDFKPKMKEAKRVKPADISSPMAEKAKPETKQEAQTGSGMENSEGGSFFDEIG